MKSISFPKMFNSTSTLVKTDYDASKECIHLLLSSEKGTFKYDPLFGIRLKRYTFDQNNYILRDQIIDEIYTEMEVFTPQLSVNRSDIKIEQVGSKLTATIKATNKADYTTNLYSLVLMGSDED